MVFPIIISYEEDWCVATDVTSGVASQGRNSEEAMHNLKEALELHYEDTDMPPYAKKIMLTTLEV